MTFPFPSISQRELSLICDTKLCPLRILGWFSRTLWLCTCSLNHRIKWTLLIVFLFIIKDWKKDYLKICLHQRVLWYNGSRCVEFNTFFLCTQDPHYIPVCGCDLRLALDCPSTQSPLIATQGQMHPRGASFSLTLFEGLTSVCRVCSPVWTQMEDVGTLWKVSFCAELKLSPSQLWAESLVPILIFFWRVCMLFELCCMARTFQKKWGMV